jgi:hypothetical protein
VKTLRRMCAASILSLALAVSAFASDVHCPGVASTDSTPITTTIVLMVVSMVC